MANLQAGQYVRAHDGATADKDGVAPRFYVAAMHDQQASAAAGRPIYRDTEMVEIFLAGNPHSKPVEKVNDLHRQRWPDHYRQFKEGQEQLGSGTDLGAVTFLTPAQIAELRGVGLKTIENIAAMSDQFIAQNFGMTGHTLRANAKAYLDDADRMAPLTKLAAEAERLNTELASRDMQITELRTLINQLTGQVSALQQYQHGQQQVMQPAPHLPLQQAAPVSSLDAVKPRRGRPPKAAVAE